MPAVVSTYKSPAETSTIATWLAGLLVGFEIIFALFLPNINLAAHLLIK